MKKLPSRNISYALKLFLAILIHQTNGLACHKIGVIPSYGMKKWEKWG